MATRNGRPVAKKKKVAKKKATRKRAPKKQNRMTAARAQKIAEEELARDIKACREEVQAICKKHNLLLIAFPRADIGPDRVARYDADLMLIRPPEEK